MPLGGVPLAVIWRGERPLFFSARARPTPGAPRELQAPQAFFCAVWCSCGHFSLKKARFIILGAGPGYVVCMKKGM